MQSNCSLLVLFSDGLSTQNCSTSLLLSRFLAKVSRVYLIYLLTFKTRLATSFLTNNPSQNPSELNDVFQYSFVDPCWNWTCQHSQNWK